MRTLLYVPTHTYVHAGTRTFGSRPRFSRKRVRNLPRAFSCVYTICTVCTRRREKPAAHVRQTDRRGYSHGWVQRGGFDPHTAAYVGARAWMRANGSAACIACMWTREARCVHVCTRACAAGAAGLYRCETRCGTHSLSMGHSHSPGREGNLAAVLNPANRPN